MRKDWRSESQNLCNCPTSNSRARKGDMRSPRQAVKPDWLCIGKSWVQQTKERAVKKDSASGLHTQALSVHIYKRGRKSRQACCAWLEQHWIETGRFQEHWLASLASFLSSEGRCLKAGKQRAMERTQCAVLVSACTTYVHHIVHTDTDMHTCACASQPHTTDSTTVCAHAIHF